MGEFTKIPNWYVYNYEGEVGKAGETLMNSNELGDKILASIIWIDNKADYLKGEFIFTLDDLINGLGFKPTRGKGKSIEQFQLSLQWLEEHQVVEFIKGSYKSKGDSMIKIKYIPQCEKNENGQDINFTRVPKDKIRQILDFKDKERKCIVPSLLTLTTIAKRIKTNERDVQESYDNGSTWKNHKNETAMMSFNTTVAPHLGDKMSERSWRKYTDLLNSKGIVYKQSTKTLEGLNSSCIYALDEQNLKQNQKGIEYAQNEQREEEEEISQAMEEAFREQELYERELDINDLENEEETPPARVVTTKRGIGQRPKNRKNFF